MPAFVYALCALTSFLCCWMLARQNRSNPGSLLALSAMAFLCFAVANILLFVDLVIFPKVDLLLWRDLVTLAGVSVLLGALIKHHGKDLR